MMKKITALFTAILILAGVSYGKNLEIKVGGMDADGKRFLVNQYVDYAEHFSVKCYLKLTNLSGKDVVLGGKKTQLHNTGTGVETWCFGSCFAGDNFPPGGIEFAAGANSDKDFYGEFSPSADGDTCIVLYKVWIDGQVGDTVSTTISFVNEQSDDELIPLNIENANKKKTSIAAYPNPANDKVTFSLNTPGGKKTRLVLRNITGSVIYSDDVSGLKSKTIDVSKFTNGLYFYTIEQNNGTVAVGKLIVQ